MSCGKTVVTGDISFGILCTFESVMARVKKPSCAEDPPEKPRETKRGRPPSKVRESGMRMGNTGRTLMTQKARLSMERYVFNNS